MNENKQKVAIVNPVDDHTKEVIERAIADDVAQFVSFYGDDASIRAVECVRSGNADVLMKGAVNTDVLLRAALDGRSPGAVRDLLERKREGMRLAVGVF